MAHSVVGLEDKVGVVVGEDLAMLSGSGPAASGSYIDKLYASCTGTIIIIAVNSEITAAVIDVILVCLLFPIN